MDAIKLQTTIDRLSELVSVPEEKKQELFTKFSTTISLKFLNSFYFLPPPGTLIILMLLFSMKSHIF